MHKYVRDQSRRQISAHRDIRYRGAEAELSALQRAAQKSGRLQEAADVQRQRQEAIKFLTVKQKVTLQDGRAAVITDIDRRVARVEVRLIPSRVPLTVCPLTLRQAPAT